MDPLLDQALALPGLARAATEPGVWLVGGAVRDLLLGRGTAARDLDLVIEEGEAAVLAARLGGPGVEIDEHERFGTAAVVLDGVRYDVARARSERYATPGALPDVAPASLADDLRRRDFTVNTFALALGGPDAGRLVSVPGAREDLDAGGLRVLHAASFRDDPTRLVRLARYAGRLGFAVKEDTRRLAAEALAAGALGTLTGPRLGAEIRLLAEDAAAVDGLAALAELGVAEAIAAGFGVDRDLAERALAFLPADGRRDRLLLALACRGVADPPELLDRLGFPRETAQAVLTALRAPEGLAGRPASEVAARLATPEQAALAGALGGADEARRWAAELRHVALAVRGEDVLAAGVPPGPEVGRVLAELLALRLDGALGDDREAQLAAARRLAAA